MDLEKQNEMEKCLQKYLRPSAAMIVVGIIFAAIGLLCVTVTPVATLVCVGFGALMIWVGSSSRKEFNNQMKQFQESGELSRVVADYASSMPLVDGRVRLGNGYIFGKGQGQVVSYGEIRQVYQHIHKKNFVENNREMRYVDPRGKVKTLCELKLRGKSDEDVIRIMAVIKAKNPSVKLGYK